MKILAVADEECKALWDYFTPDKLEGVELIIACGDLSRHYLEYLATMAPVPLLYVHGNHGGYPCYPCAAAQHGDFSDLPHRGFTVFNEILDTYHPALMLHGHIHLTYGANIPREHQYGQTRIVNCYERFVLDLPDKPDPRRHSLIEVETV